MDHQCNGPNCGNTMIGPPEFEGLQALSKIPGSPGIVLNGPNGPEFFCNDHARNARIRDMQLKQVDQPPKPPEPPKLAPEAIASLTDPRPAPLPVVHTPEVRFVPGMAYVVCQTGRILGVFTTAEKADAIRMMAEALSPEPVYVQPWRPDQPGVQIMGDEEPTLEEYVEPESPATKGKKRGKGKGSRKAQQPVQQESAAKEAEDG